MSFTLTHVGSATRPNGQWVPMMFVVKNEINYFYGVDYNHPLSEDDIQREIALGRIRKIKTPVPYDYKNTVWWTGIGYCFASKRDPVGDDQAYDLELV